MRGAVFLRRGMGRLWLGNERRLGIHPTPEAIVVVQSRHSLEGVSVEKIVRMACQGTSVAEKARTLRVRWQEEGLTGNVLVCTFPHREAIVKRLILPATDLQEIKEMVKLQACRQMPLPAEEMAVHAILLDHPSAGFSRLFMVILRKEDIRRHLEVLEQAGLAPDRLILDSWAALPMIRGRDTDEPSLVLHVSSVEMALGFFQGKILTHLRSRPLSGGTSPWPAALKEEILKTLLFLESPAHSGSLLNVYIGGDSSACAAAAEILQKEGHFHSHHVHPLQRLALGERFAQDNAMALWPALGASTQSSLNPMNLLPEEDLERRHRRDRRIELLMTAALLGLSSALLVGTKVQQRREKRRALEELIREEKQLAPHAGELRRMELQTERIQNQMTQSGSLLHVLAEFNASVPAKISIQSIVFEKDHLLQVQGSCFTLPDAARLVNELQKIPLFRKIELVSSTVRQVQGRDIIDFHLSCRLGREPPVQATEAD